MESAYALTSRCRARYDLFDVHELVEGEKYSQSLSPR